MLRYLANQKWLFAICRFNWWFFIHFCHLSRCFIVSEQWDVQRHWCWVCIIWCISAKTSCVYRETSVCLFVQSEWSIIYVLIKFSNVFITLMFEMDNPPSYVSVFCQCECVCMSEWYTFIQSHYVKLSAVYVSRLIGTWSPVLTKINHCNYTECNYVFLLGMLKWWTMAVCLYARVIYKLGCFPSD